MADNFSTQQQKIELQLKTVIAQTIINMPKSASNYIKVMKIRNI